MTLIKEVMDEYDEYLIKGRYLRISLAIKVGIMQDDQIPKDIDTEHLKEYNFNIDYQNWYQVAGLFIKRFGPERYSEFCNLYLSPNIEKRKNTTPSNYCIQDYLFGIYSAHLGLKTTEGLCVAKFSQQYSIFKSIGKSLEFKIKNLKDLVHSDLLDGQLHEAKILLKNGYIRASGAICGVIIEDHLQKISEKYSIPIKKLNPTIGDLNNLLYAGGNGVIELSSHKKIDLAGNYRNKCDHKKTQEPLKEEIGELIHITEWILKMIN